MVYHYFTDVEFGASLGKHENVIRDLGPDTKIVMHAEHEIDTKS